MSCFLFRPRSHRIFSNQIEHQVPVQGICVVYRTPYTVVSLKLVIVCYWSHMASQNVQGFNAKTLLHNFATGQKWYNSIAVASREFVGTAFRRYIIICDVHASCFRRIVQFLGLTSSGASVGRRVCGLDFVRALVGGRVRVRVCVVRTRPTRGCFAFHLTRFLVRPVAPPPPKLLHLSVSSTFQLPPESCAAVFKVRFGTYCYAAATAVLNLRRR